MSEVETGKTAINTDQVLWRAADESASVHLTLGEGLGINVGGEVVVLPVREWHRLARVVRDANANLLTALRDSRARIADLTEETEERAETIMTLQADAERPKCLYCSFGEAGPAETVDALVSHIERDCQRHPLRKADALREAAAALVAAFEREPIQAVRARVQDLREAVAA